MRLLFLTHYFHPEVGAPQTRILETASLLKDRGHEVTVLTGFPNYPDGVIPKPYRGRLFQIERLDGLKVLRSAVYPAPNRGFARRLLNHASFALSAIAASTRAGSADAVIAETPPLFTAAAAVVVARLRRAPLLLNVADLWPESAVQLGALRNPAAIRVAEAIERFSYRHARLIAVPTPGMRAILLERGYREEKVLLLPNAVDVDRFSPEAEPPGTGRIVYCGTVGLSQGVGTLIEAARRLEQDGRSIEVLIAGGGAEQPELEALVQSRGPSSVKFLGRVPRDAVPQLIASADMTAMTLRDLPLFEDALPSKLLEYMAAGRPVVAGARGQVARLLSELDAGIPCPPEDPAALAEAIARLVSDPELARRMGTIGRRYVEENLSRSLIVDRLADSLESIASADGESARTRGVYGA